ncbi:MAG: hypothetical protein ACOH5I_17170 [Oligoflexus sp.]
MADKGTQTIDLGDVQIDDLFGGSIPSVPQSGQSQQRPFINKGMDLFADSGAGPIDAAQHLNPQRPYDPGNPEEPTDLGLPPISSLTRPRTGIAAIYGLRERLEELVKPGLIVILIGAAGVFLGPDLWQYWQDMQSGDPVVTPDPIMERAPAPPRQEPVVASNRGDISRINRELIGNPYWPLPNRLQVETKSVTRMTPPQESRWRFGLNHQFTYQRYRTTREIRRSQIQGAAYLLFEALEQPKFWTRMEALFGLAEMGLQIDVDTVEKGISGTRSELVANYFRRYLENRPTAGELYVLRQAIRIVDARARLVILQVLANLGGDMNQLYLIGANYDPSDAIKAWLSRGRSAYTVSSTNRQRYQTIMAEYLNQQGGNGSVKVEELKVEELVESNILNEVQFFQELIDHEEETIVGPDEFETDGFEALK